MLGALLGELAGSLAIEALKGALEFIGKAGHTEGLSGGGAGLDGTETMEDEAQQMIDEIMDELNIPDELSEIFEDLLGGEL